MPSTVLQIRMLLRRLLHPPIMCLKVLIKRKGMPHFDTGINYRLSEDDKTPPSSPPVYSPATYDDYVPVGFYKPPLPPRPPRYYSPKGGMYKSGSSVNWNVWKGDQPDSTDTSSVIDNSKGGPPPDFDSYYFPTGIYKGDPWTPTPDQMSAMMMMMNQMQAPSKPKFGGFLAKLTQEPIALLLAAILPFTILLAAVLPTLVNMMMNGGLPIVTTTATGNNGRSLDGAEFLKPVIEAINTFGARSFDSPDCMQKIFCQITKGPAGNGTESRSFQKALYRVSTLVDKHWLDTFGVKTLFDSMQDGNCEKIPCSKQKPAPRANQSKTDKEKNVHNFKS
ncbi:uncharacterized protein LOC118189535 [Stegodyphus dumicola]|uniref:uncharacterized protein LOC118189535 n=1 Tax=Stegodyphus dumicola TaxID=202533 RepID=UPI0015AA8C90|nr:uncharacterized protein LOC118189535 [Stegodyphus dumicola]